MSDALMFRVILSALLLWQASAADIAKADTAPFLSYFGTPGMVDMPVAQPLRDGTLAFSVAQSGATLRNTLTFQITPRLSGSFRYAIIEDFDLPDNRYDRSFDLNYLLLQESGWRPAVSFGLRDFGGTGLYSGEYFVATKSFGPNLRVTGGLGWGRFAGRGGMDNPLARLDSYFETRPNAAAGGISTTGQLDADNWFRGDIAPFGGIEWQPTPRSRFVLEYSSDTYPPESRRGLIEQKSPWNAGFAYRVRPGLDLGVTYRYGTEWGISATYQLMPTEPAFPSGLDKAPPVLLPRQTVASLGWNLPPQGAPAPEHSAARVERAAAQALAEQGLGLANLAIEGRTLRLYLVNHTYRSEAQAIGRASRVLANTAPPEIARFQIIPTRNGLPASMVTINRSDLEELEQQVDGAWRMQARSTIAESPLTDGRSAPPSGDAFSYRLGPYLSPALFDPDSPVRADFGIQLGASYALQPQFILSGLIRQPLLGDLDTATRPSDSVLPRVRSEAALYDVRSDLELSYLTAEYFFRPAPQVYGRVTAGYLERMFAGVSSEVLWKPADSRLGLGLELNYAVQRDFALGFDLRDYDVWTGHASAYLDIGGGYSAQLDAGRYLAGDWGGTLSLDRTFANGISVGGFFTLTDVSFDDFGEGSFDKGIRIQIPVSWLSGQPTQAGFATVIRPVNRDGGARLNVRNRLHDLVAPAHERQLHRGWGRFWR